MNILKKLRVNSGVEETIKKEKETKIIVSSVLQSEQSFTLISYQYRGDSLWCFMTKKKQMHHNRMSHERINVWINNPPNKLIINRSYRLIDFQIFYNSSNDSEKDCLYYAQQMILVK